MLTENLLEQIVDFIDVRYAQGPLDWDDALYAVEKEFDIDLGNDMNSTDIKKIQRAVRNARK